MPYNELIKNFDRIRDYMREFYVYGFKGREEYDKKSARSYDDERRRIESWLGDYMRFHQSAEGKRVFLSIDSRSSRHNPLYRAWKAKSFTDGDITLHFILFDILHDPEQKYSLNEITKQIDTYLSVFEDPKTFDISTVRKKLKEYTEEGLVKAEKSGRTVLYSRTESEDFGSSDILNFFSEVAPCGVIGSFLLDKLPPFRKKDYFAFKHHYITSALDSEILCQLFDAIQKRRCVTLEVISRKTGRIREPHVIPLQIMISVQNGRQYLMAYFPGRKRITSIRIDAILSVKEEEVAERFGELRVKLNDMHAHMWGVSCQSSSGRRMEQVEFTVRYEGGESYIHRRLLRERRCGHVEQIDEHTSRFTAEVYDITEMIPWIRTFIGRITELHFSNKELERQFWKDMEAMYRIYGIDGGGAK